MSSGSRREGFSPLLYTSSARSISAGECIPLTSLCIPPLHCIVSELMESYLSCTDLGPSTYQKKGGKREGEGERDGGGKEERNSIEF